MRENPVIWEEEKGGEDETGKLISSGLEPLKSLIQQLDLDNQGSNRVQDPVKEESSSN